MRDNRLPPAPNRVVGLLLAGLCVSSASFADDPAQIKVTLKDHRFEPAEIHVQTGKPTILIVTNEDDTADEFDSTALRVEKVIAAAITPPSGFGRWGLAAIPSWASSTRTRPMAWLSPSNNIAIFVPSAWPGPHMLTAKRGVPGRRPNDGCVVLGAGRRYGGGFTVWRTSEPLH